MKGIKLQIIFLLGFLLFGCATSDIKTTWKAVHEFPGKYNKVLVVGIIKDEDLTLRREVEKHLSDDLKEAGYNAVSALDEYGAGGLANLGQQESYIKLRSNGIDAVITIALIDKRKEKSHTPRSVSGFASIYYYNRIWNYPAIQAELVKGHFPPGNDFFWESILFDLNTLEPQITVQTKSFKAGGAETIGHEYGKQIIGLMIKEKILLKRSNETKSL